MKLALIFLVLAFLFTVLNGEGLESETDAASVANEGELLSLEQLAKLPIKKLRGMLDKKGLKCKGCSEKNEYVTKVYESQSLQDIVAPEVEEPKATPPPIDQDKMDELMAKLKMGGFGNSRMFSAEDLKNMSPEEIGATLNNKRGGKSKRGFKSGSSKSKSSTKSKSGESKRSKPVKVETVVEEEEDANHTIEL